MTFSVEGDVAKTPDSKTRSETIHGSLYNFNWSPWTVEKCDNRKALARVRYHTNALYLLTSVITLGIYTPQNVTWWCGGEKQPDDEDEELYVPGG